MLYATALEGGSVTTATAAVVLAETMPPAIVGVLFLGDTTRHGLAAVAGLGFALAVICAVALARFGEASDGRPAQPEPEAEDLGQSAGRRAALAHHDAPDQARPRRARPSLARRAAPGLAATSAK